ncbi:MAG TPA: SDR family oxidoreductase [Gemmatimonadales bacterium]|nr:SDR family oxidoreductase [Gemmatimonadales bacterium]
MDLGLRGRVALVAGSSRGLGRALAEELAAEGATLVLCARGAEALDEAARAIGRASNAAVHTVAADLGEPGAGTRVVEEAIARAGRVDILVTNSGGPPPGSFDGLTPAQWDAAVGLILSAVIEMVRAALPGMRERRWGRILNITSITAKQPVENLMLSNTLRAAVTGFARTLANEVATSGVTVNNILPGFTRTERVTELAEVNAAREGITVAEALARFERQIPLARLAEPREFAAVAAFLVSERASYVTGQSVAVDGGWIRGLF